MVTPETAQPARYFPTHRVVKMRASSAIAARTAEGTLVSSADFVF